MFTGIIEELGHVREMEMRGEDARIVIEAHTVTENTCNGDSIAVNGVCLTALEVKPDSFAADVSKETLLRSTLGHLKTRTPVNLERAVTPATRLGGHIVQGDLWPRSDGRELLASPGHTTADGRPIGTLQWGDSLDGSTISRLDLMPYAGERTYDLLPAGATGRYWANGILLSSTLTSGLGASVR